MALCSHGGQKATKPRAGFGLGGVGRQQPPSSERGRGDERRGGGASEYDERDGEKGVQKEKGKLR